MMTLGSLFDGGGTCPFAATLMGIEPLWASEIEPYPIKVTQKNFPNMLHLGSITEINGGDIPPVDIIAGGSPCQDLSVAGKRAGIVDGGRSKLFFEMIRVITEMRNATNGMYPRFVLWENVPGALSTGAELKGTDFLAVIQHFAEIADPFVHIPQPSIRNGKLDWKNSGEVVGDGWSLAWRTFDSQFWYVPQRRKRIIMCVDLGRISSERNGDGSFRRIGGKSASEILFKREGLLWDTPTGIGAWQRTSGSSENCAGASDCGADGKRREACGDEGTGNLEDG